MNTRRIIKWGAIMAVVSFVAILFPRWRSLPEGYTYLYTPASGHRYIVAPGGIKKVGQEELDYHVSGTAVTGRVRLQVEHHDIRSFPLHMKTHQVTLGDRIQSDAH